MIFANHAHIYPKVIKPSGDLDSLKAYMEACEIDRVVAYAPFPFIFNELKADVDNNTWLYQGLKNNEAITPFGTLDFQRDDLTDQIERIVSYGFKGIKLHPAAQNFALTEERAFEVYAKAQEHNLFLSFHTGIHHSRLRDSLPILFDEIAYNFTSLRFSMEHMGGYSFFNDCLAVMKNNDREGRQPRVFAGWTSIEDKPKSAWALTDEQLERLVAQTGEQNIIFGLDFPFNDIEYTKRAIERIRGLKISDSAKENILGLNLLREIG
jgi:hypothetical protein